jgi:hypothetical protein
VGRRDGAVDVVPDALCEGVVDRVQLDPVGVMGSEVTGTAVLARVERSDLPIEPFGLMFEVGEVVTCGHQVEVAESTFPPGRLAGLQRVDRPPLLVEPGLDVLPRRDQRGEIG